MRREAPVSSEARGRGEQSERRGGTGSAVHWALVPARAGVPGAPVVRAWGDERPLAGSACGRIHRPGPASARAAANHSRARTQRPIQQVGPCVPAPRRLRREGGLSARVQDRGPPTTVYPAPAVTCSRSGERGDRELEKRHKCSKLWVTCFPGSLACGLHRMLRTLAARRPPGLGAPLPSFLVFLTLT